ncbi:hypothetical protein [Microcoleus sp. CAWBG58]|uniref:hypothetical protein n=1 Tax=Microcoleus sp. CAWBG58 TaxID=2841651 RepID=UPI0025D79C3E|nr:hypothetical protein [Microcoleus sp. CAWBG58]
MSAKSPLECASGIRRSPLRALARPVMPTCKPLRGRSPFIESRPLNLKFYV